MEQRFFKTGTPVHIYQHSADWGVIFYDDIHILSHFTLLCTTARKYGVKIYAICYMLNHLHILAEFISREQMTKFLRFATSVFSHNYNLYMGKEGANFAPRFGASFKSGSKSVVSTFNYIVNNPVEKHLVARALDYRWNFLRYAPSQPAPECSLSKRKSSLQFQLISNQIELMIQSNTHISVEYLANIKSLLSPAEWQVIVNKIITGYNIIDYQIMASYFRSMDDMLKAPDFNTGAEYELDDDSMPHKPYITMLNQIKKSVPLYSFRPWAMSADETLEWIRVLSGLPGVTPAHLKGILHID